VTGANYLIEHGRIKFLVDCGLFQGLKYAEMMNYESFPYNPKEISAVFITHSHADHMGRLPKLYKEGFRGKIYATEPAVEITKIALPDNLSLIKDEASRDGHQPLFEADDISNTFSLFEGLSYGSRTALGENITVILHDAGHILGSSIIEINWTQEGNNKKIYFTGDLGNVPTPLLNQPYQPDDADYIVIESTYGSRIHEDRLIRRSILSNIIVETMRKGGTILIPSFALERTQEILYELHQLLESQLIPEIPIYLDSPLAIKITDVYRKYTSYFNSQAQKDFKDWGGLFNFKRLIFTPTVQQSKSINEVKGPKIVIAGSGMSIGGRILHHEQRYLSDPNSTIIFIGYQVANSLGRKILDGQPLVSVLGQNTAVNCRVEAIGGYSAHADKAMLAEWIRKANGQNRLKKVFIVQGELQSAQSLAEDIKNSLKVVSFVPSVGESYELE
jgi:metallo-beta-lactamase family protein